MIIAINGRIGAGKDTVGEIIQKLCLTNNGPEFEIKKFAGKLKTIASLLTGIPVEMFEDQEFKKTNLSNEWSSLRQSGRSKVWLPMTVRELLQKLGTEALRNGLHENVWCNALFSDYKMSHRQHPDIEYVDYKVYPNWIITDLRFPNELEAVKQRWGITIRVVRPVHDLSQENHCGILHPSETALNDAEFDYEIINDGSIEDLVKKVREILIKERII